MLLRQNKALRRLSEVSAEGWLVRPWDEKLGYGFYKAELY
jgi:hypothetical protein